MLRKIWKNPQAVIGLALIVLIPLALWCKSIPWAGASHFDSVGRDWFNPWNDDSVYRRLV